LVRAEPPPFEFFDLPEDRFEPFGVEAFKTSEFFTLSFNVYPFL
jgi:hypothetical protein